MSFPKNLARYAIAKKNVVEIVVVVVVVELRLREWNPYLWLCQCGTGHVRSTHEQLA